MSLSIIIERLTGSQLWYALVLFPLSLLLAVLYRVNPRQLGLRIGAASAHFISLLFPVAVMLLSGVVMAIFMQIRPSEMGGAELARRMARSFVYILPILLVTEELFFRGFLWGLLEQKGYGVKARLMMTSGAFGLWHVWVAATFPDFILSSVGLPIYFGNILLLGACFGMLKEISGSLLVPTLSHCIWNTLLYELYGSGTVPGYFIGFRPELFDPERGLLGLVLNLTMFLLLWRFNFRGQHKDS